MKSDLLDELREVFKRVNKNFHYKRDFNVESWDMPPPGYDGKQFLFDDCDGFCLACRVLLRERGISSRLVYCEVDNAGHLVVEVDGWILDVLQDKVISNSLLHNTYRWLRISGYEAGDPWRKIVHPIS